MTEVVQNVEASEKKQETPLLRDKLIDIYVRLNGDTEKDYCFCIPRDSPVSCLHDIFKKMPILLSPTFFYYHTPAAFHLDTSPGFITSEGAILFNSKGKHKAIEDETVKIGDIAREGQLFIPMFKHNLRRWFFVVGILLFWLYTDLPEWMTPTPGISVFAISTRLYDHYFPEPDAAPMPDIENDGIADIFFFGFHCIKVTVIFLIFFFGGYNPYYINPFRDAGEISADNLRDIGWTGSRRVTPEEWREENRTRRIEQAGGPVKAYEQGILLSLQSAGVFLQPGEGFNTPVGFVPPPTAPSAAQLEKETVLIKPASAATTGTEAVSHAETETEKPVNSEPEPKPVEKIDVETVLWRLGPDYETLLTKYRRAEIKRRMDIGDTVAVALKEWRRIGPLVAPPEIVEKYRGRKLLDSRPDLYTKFL
ncbi:glucose signaling factor 2-domain-containing protein [Lipomyces arxii]|uniref:glucose signaling factor 2-domain-containing protein n=1 Tax=Lipomyces arxii TaxID=56418 RepID=UPI0034CF2B33